MCTLSRAHVYIKPRSPELNGKVERSHRSDQEEFYQLLTYKDDVDLKKKLQEWERYYNYNRLHGAFQGKTPYEVLKALLQSTSKCLTRSDISHCTATCSQTTFTAPVKDLGVHERIWGSDWANNTQYLADCDWNRIGPPDASCKFARKGMDRRIDNPVVGPYLLAGP
jgi:hypothetical protein